MCLVPKSSICKCVMMEQIRETLAIILVISAIIKSFNNDNVNES